MAAGEQVLDVQPKLAARVRLLASGAVNKNDPNDARSVAVAALRSPSCLPVRPDDHAAVLKIWAKRHRDLSRTRNQVACRLHAALCELVPGGVSKEIYAAHAAAILEEAEPCGAVAQARAELAAELVADLRRADTLLRETKKKLATAVRASGTSLTEVFGVGPVIAATVIGDVRDVSRFGGRDRFAAYNGTAPIEVSSGNRKVHRLPTRGNRRLNHAIHMAAVTQVRYRHSPGRAYYDKKIAEGKTGKEALRALKRQISDAIYKHLKADAARAAARSTQGPGGQPGNDSVASAAGYTPNASSSAKPLPDLPPPYDHGPGRPPQPPEKRPPGSLDTKRHRSVCRRLPRAAGQQRVQIWGFCAGLPRGEPAVGRAWSCPGCLSREPGATSNADGITSGPEDMPTSTCGVSRIWPPLRESSPDRSYGTLIDQHAF